MFGRQSELGAWLRPFIAILLPACLALAIFAFGGTVSGDAAAAPTQPSALSVVRLSTLAAVPGQEVRITVDGLPPDTMYAVTNNTRRMPTKDCQECAVTSSVTTEMTVVRSSSAGQLATSFLVPLDWRGTYRIDLRTPNTGVEAADPAWLTAAPALGAPLMKISSTGVRVGGKLTTTLTGLRPRTRYAVLNSTWRDPGTITTATNSNPQILASGVSNKRGSLKLTLRVPTTMRPSFQLFYVAKVHGQTAVPNARTWIEVIRHGSPGRV